VDTIVRKNRLKTSSSGTLVILPLPPSLQTFLCVCVLLLQCFGHICTKNEVSSLTESVFEKIGERGHIFVIFANIVIHVCLPRGKD